MEQFSTLVEAAQLAATRCNFWKFATSDEQFDMPALLTLAETSDAENPSDEDSFYVVSPTGAIGLIEDSGDVDWLFIAASIQEKRM